MAVFFIQPEQVTSSTISIGGQLLTHLRDSLRLTTGETVWFGDGAGHRYRTEIVMIAGQTMTARILEVHTQPLRCTPLLLLGQAILKGEKFEWVIQKATELGIHTITPIQSEQSVVRLRPERLAGQLARWSRIALEAAQQSEQWAVPTITPPRSLKEVISTLPPHTISLFLVERQEGMGLSAVPLPPDARTTILLLIGPEGGWSKEEVLMARQAGCTFITLGPAILRAETAAITAISILQSRLGNLGPVSPAQQRHDSKTTDGSFK